MNENETLDNYIEINEISKSIETDTYTLESAINDLSSLINVFDVIENAKTLDQSTTDISTIAIEGIYKRLNYKPKFLSLESYEDKNNRTLNTTLSLEGIFKSISDTFKKNMGFYKENSRKNIRLYKTSS